MTHEEDLEATTGGGFKRPGIEEEPKKNGKVKRFFRTVGKKTGKGAKVVGVFVSRKVGESIKAAKERRTPEAKLERIESKEQILIARQKLISRRQQIETQRASLRKIQLTATGINVPKFVRGTQELGVFASPGGMGFQSLGMGDSLGGGVGGLPKMDLGNILGGAPGVTPTPRVAPTKVLRKFRTVKPIKRIRIKSGKRKGKFRSRTTKRRVAIRQRAAPAQPAPFDPLSQI